MVVLCRTRDDREVEENNSSPELRNTSMHDLLIGAGFLAMLVLPCIVAMKSSDTENV